MLGISPKTVHSSSDVLLSRGALESHLTPGPGHEFGKCSCSRNSRSLFGRLLNLASRASGLRSDNRKAYGYEVASTTETPDCVWMSGSPQRVRRGRRSRLPKLLLRVVLGLLTLILASFGVLHIVLVVLARKTFFSDVDLYNTYPPNWGKAGQVGEGLVDYPTDATRGVLPIPCASHNDYWRRVPLFDALHAGCSSVEADVWLFDGEDELLIGHNTASLTRERTFRSLYIDPLVELLDRMNPRTEFNNSTDHGVFDEDPAQTFVLLVDFKTAGHELFPRVLQQLEPLRRKNYLSYWDGNKLVSRAVTVVGTGNTPFDLVLEYQDGRDIFFDAPIDEMWESGEAEGEQDDRVSKRGQGKTGTGLTHSPNAFNVSNSYYASVSFKKSIGYLWRGRLSSEQLHLLRGQIRGAKRRGLQSRYWDTPSWPTSLRNHVWQVLLAEGADVLNVDDLRAAASLDWIDVKHDWLDA
ncbi:Altered inheritance of mitochondria protein 6 [Vermiconidia calcicola]|uniref:Altered inheritance of mitochondria protein 6 n=1 Tax=Vermiconidia calcicola TaxID=1690605 RepID=A0ACC3N258_9PEZI|nr:Altered inheritance of mitochondria protein 6 [Vermiconidia calcicola]